MAHNPPAPTRLDVTDRVGILALDENHFYDHVAGYGVFDPVSAATVGLGCDCCHSAATLTVDRCYEQVLPEPLLRGRFALPDED